MMQDTEDNDQRPQITLRWEVLKSRGVHEHTFKAPDGWEDMTNDERVAYCEDNLEASEGDFVSMTYEFEGMPD